MNWCLIIIWPNILWWLFELLYSNICLSILFKVKYAIDDGIVSYFGSVEDAFKVKDNIRLKEFLEKSTK